MGPAAPILLPLFAAAIAGAGWWWFVMRPAARAPGATAPASPSRDRYRAPDPGGYQIVVAGAATALVMAFLTRGAGVPLAVLVLSLGAFVVLRARRRTERARQEESYAIEAIRTADRALRAGIPISGVLRILADESQGTARTAFREILARDELGEELGAAVRAVLMRSPVHALRAFGLALVLQLRAGGNLADVTDRLAHSLVERLRVRRRARTIVTYSRTAANVIAVLPLVAIPMMSWLLEGYSDVLLESRSGNIILAIASLMIVTGIVIIQRLGRLDPVGEWRTS
jgi:tight adherence protein B